MNLTRQYGTITEAALHKVYDDRIWCCDCQISFEGNVQTFGGIKLDVDGVLGDLAASYVSGLCSTFGVEKLEDLKGKNCYILRCFDEWNGTIEGLEAMSGRKFLLTAWRRKIFPDTKNPLEEKRETLLAEADHLARRVSENARRLATLEASYVDHSFGEIS